MGCLVILALGVGGFLVLGVPGVVIGMGLGLSGTLLSHLNDPPAPDSPFLTIEELR